jgi:aldose 1-epimerase
VRAPSGEQFLIRHGDQEAIAVEVGGGLRTYTVAGRPVLDGYAENAMCDGARCQTLVPWPNRVKDGRWNWHGDSQQLALSEPDQHNAIHGVVRWLPWRVRERTSSEVELFVRSFPQPGYPWELETSNRWTLDGDGLSVVTTITNCSDTDAPIAAGFHPYLTVGTATIDTAVLSIPAATRILTGDQQIPTGSEPVTGTDYDFRSPREIGSLKIDHTFTDLDRDDAGRARLRLANPAGDAVSLWVDAAYPFLEIFTGDALPDPARRRQGLGVEPMTAPPNALATGESLVVLAPGQSWEGHWGVTLV